MAYAIVAATIYHELAQELADYFLLTTHVGLKPWKALLLNFTSGLSVVLGAVLILALDISNMATGCILAISAGVSLFVVVCDFVYDCLAVLTIHSFDSPMLLTLLHRSMSI